MIKVTVHEETRGQWKNDQTLQQPTRNHGSQRPDNIPLICTGAGPIHPVHSKPMLLATEAMPEKRLHFCHFPGFSSVVVILWCLRFPTLICSPCVRDSLYLILLMSLHLFSDCMSFDLELYKLQTVCGVKLFIISIIFFKFVQSLSPFWVMVLAKDRE